MQSLFKSGLVLLSAFLLAMSLLGANPLGRAAEQVSEEVVASAIAIYASLRAINAFLSTAQEVEIGASFVASGSVQPLKMLEPLDDTVERVSGLVLGITVAGGILALGLGPVVALGYGAVLLGWGVSFLRPAVPVGSSLLRLGIGLGFALPLACILGGWAGDLVTARVFAGHEALIAEIARDLAPRADLPATTTVPGDVASFSWLLNPLGQVSEAGEAVSQYWAAAQALLERSDDLVISYVQIIATYVLKALILPLSLLLCARVALRAI